MNKDVLRDFLERLIDVHFSKDLSDEWFAQFTAEARASRETATGTQSRWTKMRRRNEVIDCAVGVIWLEQHFELNRKSTKWWDELESRFSPPCSTCSSRRRPASPCKPRTGSPPPACPFHRYSTPVNE